MIRETFLKFALSDYLPKTSAREWKGQLELAIALLKQVQAHETDLEGNKITEDQLKLVAGLLERTEIHLDIINKELEQS